MTLVVLMAFALTGHLAGWQASDLNRRLGRALAFVLVVEAISASAFYATHMPSQFFSRGLFFYWFVATGIIAASVDLRLFPAAFGYLFAFVAVWQWPATRYACATIANLCLTIVIALVWLRGSKQV